MIGLLRASGVEARYVQGTLPDPLAQQLIASMFPDPSHVVGCILDGIEIADPLNDPMLLAETRQHYWVEFDAGNGLMAADGAFSDALLGDEFANALTKYNS